MAPANLNTLSTELVSNILSHLEDAAVTKIRNPLDDEKHPFYNIAAVSKQLAAQVEDHCRHLLAMKGPSNRVTKRTAKSPALRKKWIEYKKKHCHHCGTRSVRKAIMEPDMICCAKCDRLHYPKRTMSTVLADTCLSKLDIFTPNILHPNLPPLRKATYMCMGGPITVIRDEDVSVRAEYVEKIMQHLPHSAMSRRRRHARAIGMMDERILAGKWMPVKHPTHLPMFPDTDMSAEGRRAEVLKLLEPDFKAIKRVRGASVQDV